MACASCTNGCARCGGAPDRNPLSTQQQCVPKVAQRLLSEVAGFGRFVGVKRFTGSVLVANAATTVFVSSTMGNAVEGMILGYWYNWAADDYQTSPVSLVTFDAQIPTTAGSGTAVMPPFVIPAPPNGFVDTYPYGVWLKPGMGVGLQITNGEDASFFAQGWINVAYWQTDNRVEADGACAADACSTGSAAPWARNGPLLTGRPQ